MPLDLIEDHGYPLISIGVDMTRTTWIEATDDAIREYPCPGGDECEHGERSPMPDSPVTPLTPEELAELREALAFWNRSGYTYGDEASFYRTSHNRAESHYVATVTPTRLARLLATLDAARAESPEVGAVDGLRALADRVRAERDALPKGRLDEGEVLHVREDTGELLTEVQRGSLRGQSAMASAVLRWIDEIAATPPSPDGLRTAARLVVSTYDGSNFVHDVIYEDVKDAIDALRTALENGEQGPNGR